MTATQEGDAFKQSVEPILELLGPYPHAELNPGKRICAPDESPDGFKPQGTRLLKVMCPQCGYTVRVTQKWLVDVGPPLCPRLSHKGRVMVRE